MMFYESLYKTACCAQQICLGCAQDYLKGGEAMDEDALLETLPPTECPYCAVQSLQFVRVLPSEAPRRYEDSPAVVRKLAQSRTDALQEQARGAGYVAHSPLKARPAPHPLPRPHRSAN